MARDISKKQRQSTLSKELKREISQGIKDPKGKKSFRKGLEIASLVIPGGAAVKAGAKGVKVAKAAKAAKTARKVRAKAARKVIDKAKKREYIEEIGSRLDGEYGPMTLSMKKGILRDFKKKKINPGVYHLNSKERALLKKIEKLDKPMKQSTKKVAKKKKGVPLSVKSIPLLLERSSNLKSKKMKAGGVVKSHRGDGIARSGRTKGRIV